MLAVLLLNRMTSMATRRRIKKQEKIEICVEIVPQTSDDSYCRTCLGTEDLVPIFSEDRTEEKRSRELKVTTGLQIKKNDGLSQRICGGCIESLNQALKFRRKSKKAEKTLLNRISDKKPKKKYTKSSKPKKTENEFEVNITEYTDNDYEDGFQDDVDFKQEDEPVQIKQEKIEVKKSPRVKRKLVGPGPSSYKCNICNKEFRMKATYKAHMRFHTNYCVCESCGKRCRNNNQLQEHKRARHGLGRIHKCAYCEYSSATKEALTIHERRHTGERPYICDHCGATFHRRSNLVQHIAIHLPEKNFQCPVCQKMEISKKRLQIHISKSHRARQIYRYLCAICPKHFQKPDHARRHLVRCHGVTRDQQGDIQRLPIEMCNNINKT